MAAKVKFLRGSREQFDALTKNSNTFYYCEDTKEFYLGDVLLSNGNIDTIEERLQELALAIDTIENELQDVAKVFIKTTDEWNLDPSQMSQKNTFYVYSDHMTSDGKLIPGIKIGDGKAYIADLPFIDDIFINHINDNVRHITQEERESWNNKVRAYYEQDDLKIAPVEGEELLVLTRN